jgi:hypothetical protein
MRSLTRSWARCRIQYRPGITPVLLMLGWWTLHIVFTLAHLEDGSAITQGAHCSAHWLPQHSAGIVWCQHARQLLGQPEWHQLRHWQRLCGRPKGIPATHTTYESSCAEDSRGNLAVTLLKLGISGAYNCNCGGEQYILQGCTLTQSRWAQRWRCARAAGSSAGHSIGVLTMRCQSPPPHFSCWPRI